MLSELQKVHHHAYPPNCAPYTHTQTRTIKGEVWRYRPLSNTLCMLCKFITFIIPKPCPISTLDKHFVDHHRTALIDRVSQVAPILDRLLQRGVITSNAYSDVRAEKTKQNRMRELIDVPLKASGSKGKDVFLDILMEQEPYLISELKGE